jgi:hypothetical protein
VMRPRPFRQQLLDLNRCFYATVADGVRPHAPGAARRDAHPGGGAARPAAGVCRTHPRRRLWQWTLCARPGARARHRRLSGHRRRRALLDLARLPSRPPNWSGLTCQLRHKLTWRCPTGRRVADDAPYDAVVTLAVLHHFPGYDAAPAHPARAGGSADARRRSWRSRPGSFSA